MELLKRTFQKNFASKKNSRAGVTQNRFVRIRLNASG